MIFCLKQPLPLAKGQVAADSQTDTLPLLGATGEDDLILGTSDPSTVLLSLCKIPLSHTPAEKKNLGRFLVDIVKCVTAEKKDLHVKPTNRKYHGS